MHAGERPAVPVALTFDALAGARASATFFVVAPLAERYPSLLTPMRDEGHDVAFHCTRHARHDDSTHEEIEADVEQVLLTLGGSVRYWRTP
jgi:peptidoglycan/xylan/chitin deacetylase (PgdA/CDA1 family)